MDWKVSDEKADTIIKLLVKQPRGYSRENSANWKRRGPKPKLPVTGEIFHSALKMRADGMGKEAIARELKISSRTLGRAFDRHDQEGCE
jgi:hypothetical protein